MPAAPKPLPCLSPPPCLLLPACLLLSAHPLLPVCLPACRLLLPATAFCLQELLSPDDLAHLLLPVSACYCLQELLSPDDLAHLRKRAQQSLTEDMKRRAVEVRKMVATMKADKIEKAKAKQFGFGSSSECCCYLSRHNEGVLRIGFCG